MVSAKFGLNWPSDVEEDNDNNNNDDDRKL